MRLLVPLAVMLGLVTSGCFLFQSCGGSADWTEPSAPDWLRAHGAAAGFDREPAEEGLEAPAGLAKVLPADSTLRSVGTTLLLPSGGDASLTLGPDHVGLVARAELPLPEILAAANATLVPLFAGSEDGYAAAVKDFAKSWSAKVASFDDPSFHLLGGALELTGPWNLSALDVPALDLQPSLAGLHRSTVGNWSYTVSVDKWTRGRALEVDALGHAETVGDRDSPEAVQEWVRSQVPGYSWAFQDFQFIDYKC